MDYRPGPIPAPDLPLSYYKRLPIAKLQRLLDVYAARFHWLELPQFQHVGGPLHNEWVFSYYSEVRTILRALFPYEPEQSIANFHNRLVMHGGARNFPGDLWVDPLTRTGRQ